MNRPHLPAASRVLLPAMLSIACSHHHGHQAGDLTFEPTVDRPTYAAGSGPRVAVDEGHCNLHRAGGTYRPFAELLRRDGFVVEPIDTAFSADALAGVDVLVVSNALGEENCHAKEWRLPNPSAFGAEEIAAVDGWVAAGGALLLIADHMPFPGAAEELARAFGVAFINGYARPDEGGFIDFERADGTLAEHPVTAGRSADERVETVVSFTGQGFRPLRDDVAPLLTLPPATTMRMPRQASVFTEKTPSFSAEGLLQGAVLAHGEGRVAVFGEAAMFTAQESSHGGERFRFGMNAPGAEDNAQFVLNLMHWLTGTLAR